MEYILDLVGSVGNVVNNTVNLAGSAGINVGKEPVILKISLHSPRQRQTLVLLLEVHEACLRVLLGTSSPLDDVVLKRLLSLSLSSIGADLETKDVGGTLQSGNGINLPARDQWVLRWDFAGEERVSVGEDVSVSTDL